MRKNVFGIAKLSLCAATAFCLIVGASAHAVKAEEILENTAEKVQYTAFAQIDGQGNLSESNALHYDEVTKEVKSQSKTDFVNVSGGEMEITEGSPIDLYKTALSDGVISGANGTGVVLDDAYWSFDFDVKSIIGDCIKKADIKTAGKYFKGYVIKKESDFNKFGYHVDGYIEDVKVTPTEDPTPNEDPNPTPNEDPTPNENPTPNIDPTPSYDPDIENLPTVIDPSLLPTPTPEAVVEEVPEEEIVIEETPEVPAGEANEFPEFEFVPTETPVEEEIVPELPETPAGEAEEPVETLPQTGTLPTELFYGLGAAFVAFGGAAVVFGKKRF